MAHVGFDHEGVPDEFIASFPKQTGFVDHLGLQLDFVSPDRVTAHLDVGPQHVQPYGILHGGVHCSIVETLASVGAAANVVVTTGSLAKGVVGVANQTDFLRPVRTGRMDAVATPIHAGRTQQLWLVEIAGADEGTPVARGQVRLHVIDMPTG